ncbi:MAG: hypothetical protein M3552_03540 [Planctomycetota bacterium]|nr:hypothetical protein [Planctomycetota bacterium]
MIASEVPNALRDRNAAAQARRELDRLGVAIHLRMYPPHDRPRNEGVRR